MMDPADIRHMHEVIAAYDHLCGQYPVNVSPPLQDSIDTLKQELADDEEYMVQDFLDEAREFYAPQLVQAIGNYNGASNALSAMDIGAARFWVTEAEDLSRARNANIRADEYDDHLAEEIGAQQDVLYSPSWRQQSVEKPIRALLQDMQDGVISGKDLFSEREMKRICVGHYVRVESGLIDRVQSYLTKESIAHEAVSKSGEIEIIAPDKGRGIMLHLREDDLRLVFTGHSEEQFREWPALVTAYNMRNPQQEPLEFTREKDGSYIVKGDAAALQELAEHMHRGLMNLQDAPEQSLPPMAAHERAISRER